ncbi:MULTISPECIES: protein kinase domain-containing protein [Kitasatospora]|uniref:Serine/threonine-protein kinase n=2 Tax=Kitasatospora TaxID=2063 RepID=A0ABT1J6S3_9ACTN|nr:protein kinase [Kitasatospora paracochleata]MCP2313130.1 serine/threonine-protein kinase [Kitasatospora paracochleata]
MSDGTTAEGHSLGNGRYVLQRLLGQGGMASVHLAYDSVLDRQVAVKTLHTELGREASFKERFRREAQAVARLQHINIVSVFDSGEDVAADGTATPYIVMEYVEGQALKDVLDDAVTRYGAMPTEQALKITAAVLSALEASHDQGLVHRDIKPGNVMVSSKGVVKVMDFGIARALQSGVTSMTQTGMVVGTPQYLSPEQALGKSVDARSDLYSVGCMLFELLSGQLPFDGDSAFSIAYKHVQEAPPAPSTLNRAVTPAVDALVARALRKDPAHRFPSAAAMREEVERVAGGEQGGTPLQASTPLVISEGPRSVHAAPSLANFPQVTGDLRTPAPQVQQPYQPGPQTPPPYATPGPYPAPQTPPPYPQTPQPFPQAPQTPQPFPQAQAPHTPQPFPQTPPPYPQAPHTPQPFPQQQVNPVRPMPGPQFTPTRTANNGGCSTALIVVGVIVGVIVLAVVIVAIAATAGSKSTTDNPYGAPRPATVLDLGGSAQGDGLI